MQAPSNGFKNSQALVQWYAIPGRCATLLQDSSLTPERLSPAKVSAVVSVRGDDGVLEVQGSLHALAHSFLSIISAANGCGGSQQHFRQLRLNHAGRGGELSCCDVSNKKAAALPQL